MCISSVVPSHYDLSIFNINKTDFTFSGTVAIDLTIQTETNSISLNVKELEIVEAVISANQTKSKYHNAK